MTAPLTPLPIDRRLDAIVAGLRSAPSLVLVAEPGAGKTTRVPRALLDAGFADAGDIVVLEPRRLAVRLAARRVAEELGEEVGRRIGYQVRFEQRAGKDTRVRFVTEGILTRRLQDDPTLAGVSAVIFDEFHERHLHTDLGLALLREAQRTRRPDLRIVVMSATMEAAPVAEFLGCEVLSAEGRAYPIAIEHLPEPDDRPLHVLVSVALQRLVLAGVDGDVLVFLPGAGEIRRAHESCAPICERAGFELAALHGDLPAEEQDRVVRPGPRPKVILSTNVAETSVTIPGVVAVIDSGLARVAKHSPWTGLPSLEVAKISRASAEQRAGRAGRTRAGRCLRLYTAHDLAIRPAHDDPEIRRADLAETVLGLRATGHDPHAFPYFEAPPTAAVDAADALLARLGAVDGTVTALGRRMLALPVHPRIARLALEADARGVGARGCLVAALVGEREIRREARTSFGGRERRGDQVGSSDVLVRLEAFEAAEVDGLGARTLKAHGLDVAAGLSVARARDQLARLLRVSSTPSRGLAEEEGELLESLLAAFPDRVGKRREPNGERVVFAGGGSGKLDPASVVKEAELMVVVDVVEGRGGAVIRAASAIEAEWLLELFPERVEERVSLRFDPDTEQVEKVVALLYDGLVLDESVRRDVEGPEVGRVLAEAALAAGLPKLWDMDALEGLLCRLELLATHGLLPKEPDEARVRRAVEACCEGARSFADLRRTRLTDAIVAGLPSKVASHLRDYVPETVAIAGRPNVPVHYERGRPPWIESRMQDFFGTKQGPSVADGRVPVVLHLLAPNGRAVQVTTDLAGFWERHWPALRKELMRKYPRHAWPEDPTTAVPSKPGRRR